MLSDVVSYVVGWTTLIVINVMVWVGLAAVAIVVLKLLIAVWGVV
jgi:hypothetical protein